MPNVANPPVTTEKVPVIPKVQTPLLGIIELGTITGIPNTYITQTTTNGLTQANNNYFYGEVSLPLTAASAVAGTQDIDYPMNLALPPGYKILVGLGTSVSAGWSVFAIAGKY